MAYFTEQQLENFADSPELEKRASQHILESFSASHPSIFLSHSHKDAKKARGIIRHFGDIGIQVYVDWNDGAMPPDTNRETAERIKARIAQSGVFMVLATHNALVSRWVPWEIGVADKTKGESGVLVIPVADWYGKFDGNEYLQLYRRLVIADSGADAVFEPGQTRGELLTEYLRHHAQ